MSTRELFTSWTVLSDSHHKLTRSFINVPFLNLIALITERAGRINIRVGGNTQETAVLVDSLPGGVAIAKDKGVTSNPVSELLIHIRAARMS